ncbi:MAG: hypothetical protein M1834_009325 [Cirrosporium novae-zelandiae]|nr:MAG: hypothetical protein M1834_009325 [Cirrosporium novae-zelandiae]
MSSSSPSPPVPTSPVQNILILGATGKIGSYITTALLNATPPPFKRIAIFTSQDTAERKKEVIEGFKGKGAEILVGDLGDLESVGAAYRGIDTIISALGRDALLAQIPLITLAAQTPTIHRFIPSEYGTDIAFDATSAHEKPHQAKLKVRAWLEQKSAEVAAATTGENGRRLEYWYLVTGPYADPRPPMYFSDMSGRAAVEAGSFDVHRREAVVLGDGKGRVAFCTCRDVANFLLQTLLSQPPTTKSHILKLHSFITTPLEIVAEFERQTSSPWSIKYTSLDHLRELEERAWKGGEPLAAVYSLRRIWTEGRTLYDEKGGWDEGVLGLGVGEGGKGTDRLEEAVGIAIEFSKKK